jgi:hypothetical protein
MDPLSMQGLLDMVTLGNLLELCWFYDEQAYQWVEDKTKTGQRKSVISLFSMFKDMFQSKQCLMIDGELMDPMTALFQPTLLQLAVQIFKYKQRETSDQRKYPFTTRQLRRALYAHFEKLHPSLLQALKDDFAKSDGDLEYCTTFEWTGPDFTIVARPQGKLVNSLKTNVSNTTKLCPLLFVESVPPQMVSILSSDLSGCSYSQLLYQVTTMLGEANALKGSSVLFICYGQQLFLLLPPCLFV